MSEQLTLELKRKPLTDPEVSACIKEYDELERMLEGEAKAGGDRQSIYYTVINGQGWTQEKTAHDLGISQPAVAKAGGDRQSTVHSVNGGWSYQTRG